MKSFKSLGTVSKVESNLETFMDMVRLFKSSFILYN